MFARWRAVFLLLTFSLVVKGYQVSNGPLLKYRPYWLKTCERDDPNLNKCLTDLFDGMFPQLATGIPEIDVEGFEPLQLDRLTITKGTGAVTLSGSFFNITVVGPSNSTPTFTDMDVEGRKLGFGIYFPRLEIWSKYDLKGKILILPLVGHGDCQMTLTGINTKVDTNISFVEKEGREIMHVDTMKVMFSVSGIKIHLDNLFNGNKILGLTVNGFLNERGTEIVNDLEESIGEALSQIFIEITNNVFSKMPTDLWLPKLVEAEAETTTKLSLEE